MAKKVPKSTAALSLLVVLLSAALWFFYTAYRNLEASYGELRHRYEELLAQNATVIIINDRDYFDVARELVEKASKSIYVIMYVLKYKPGDPDYPVNQLVWALGNACQRGVEVSVILEGDVYEGGVMVNQAAYDYFVSVGVNVTFDSGHVRTHCKLVVVDELMVLVGSHNWTEYALERNHEASVLIISEEVAEEEIEYFNELWAEATGG